jgi:hypothetical protein
MSRFFISFFGTLLVVIVIFWFWVVKKPMAYFADSYPLWQTKIDMAHSLPPDSIAMLGDSRVESDIIPAKVAGDIYDLGLDGGSPIDAFALARILVASPHPPRAVIFSINPLHCMVTEFLWTFSAQYGLIDYSALDQIRMEARKTDDKSLWATTDLAFKHLQPLFGELPWAISTPESTKDWSPPAFLLITFRRCSTVGFFYGKRTTGKFTSVSCKRGATILMVPTMALKKRRSQPFCLPSFRLMFLTCTLRKRLPFFRKRISRSTISALPVVTSARQP